MFYKDPLDLQLRLGDVLVHQTIASISIDRIKSTSSNNDEINVQICKSNYAVILTPCCSIEQDLIVLTPLIQIKAKFNENPYFKEDFARINRLMAPQQSVSPSVWGEFTQEEKARRQSQGNQYALIENFIYEPLPQLTTYTVNYNRNGQRVKENINCYMVDFRFVTQVKSKNIRTQEGIFLGNKIAQLSIDTRSDLRKKLADYYGRTPQEDQIVGD